MDEIAHVDPHVEIERLEARIEELAAKLESCRKFVLAARLAIALGGVMLLAGVFGLIRFELMSLSTAFAALLAVSWCTGRTPAPPRRRPPS